jgi:hypothetical protein
VVAGTPLPLNIVLALVELLPAAYDVGWISKIDVSAKIMGLAKCFPNMF